MELNNIGDNADKVSDALDKSAQSITKYRWAYLFGATIILCAVSIYFILINSKSKEKVWENANRYYRIQDSIHIEELKGCEEEKSEMYKKMLYENALKSYNMSAGKKEIIITPKNEEK